MKVLFELGTLLANILVRSKVQGDARDNFIDIVSALKTLGVDTFEARNIARTFERISDDIAASCMKILEKFNLQENRINIIVKEVINAYERAFINIEDIFNLRFDEGKVKNQLLSRYEEYLDNLNPSEYQVYERMLEHTSHLIVNAYINLPEFGKEGVKRLNVKMDEIAEKIEELIDQMERVNSLVDDKGEQIRNFERQYRNNIISKNMYINLFGAGSLEREYKKYQLSIAYVELEIFDNVNGKPIRLVELFKKHKNIWLSGEAGSGKTTLLQWIAINAALDSQEIEGLRDAIPVFIKLREIVNGDISLKMCIQNVMKDSSYEVPKGWIEDALETGRMIFLIDGFDEIAEKDREIVLTWLEEVDNKGRCRKIFTARPQVKERPINKMVQEVKILPMDRVRIRRFVEYWNKAVLEEQLRVDVEESGKMTIGLVEKIQQSESLYRLASSPLLCAMICALHYRNDMHLPSNKRELYEECCKMLIENRDMERKIIISEIKLTYEQKKIILAQLAYWMMKNKNRVEISRDEAERVVERVVNGMYLNQEINFGKNIFKYLLERSGILREPEENKIDFVHRTFQEYLTACEISRNEDWGYIEEKLGDTVWQETIEMSIGYAKKDTATKLIKQTLKMGQTLNEEKKYLFVAVSYLKGALEVDQDVREAIEKRVTELIPPKRDECVGLVATGNLVVPYLINKKEYGYEERATCIRVLTEIASINTLEIIKTYFDRRLSFGEFLDIGELFAHFTEKELTNNDIPELFKEYVRNYVKGLLVLDKGFWKVINCMEEKDVIAIFDEQITQLELYGCEGDIPLKYCKVFGNIKGLNIYGEIPDISKLEYFDNLTSLYIGNPGKSFSIYSMNKYNLSPLIEDFTLYSYNKEYINGNDLDFLKNVKRLRFYFTNNLSEISFENFSKFPLLEELLIGAEFADELDYSELPSNISKLTICVPEDRMDMLKSELELQLLNTEVCIQAWDR